MNSNGCTALLALEHDAIEVATCSAGREAIRRAETIEGLAAHKLAGDWAVWLAGKVRALHPARKAYGDVTASTRKAYDDATASARKAYDDATASACKAYDDATASAHEAYLAKKASAYEAYLDATASAYDAYVATMVPARKAYDDATDPAREALIEAVVAYYKGQVLDGTR